MSFIKKIFSSFKNIHLQSLLGNGTMAIFGFVTTALLYRALKQEEMGIYFTFITVLGFIDTIRSGFLTTAFIKFYSGTELNRGREVVGSAWGLAIAITTVCILFSGITYFAFNITNESILLFLKFFAIISLATLPSFMANIFVQGDKRFDHLLWLRLVNQISFVGTVIVLMVLKKTTLTSVVYTYIGANLLCSLIAIVMGWTKLDSLLKFTTKTFLELFHFGKYSVTSSLSSNLFKITDIFFINLFLGPAALAVYNLGSRLLQIIELLLLSFAASGMPSLADHYNNDRKESMVYVMKKMIGMLTWPIIGVAVISVIFANPIIAILGGKHYTHTEAPNLFRIFMCLAVLYPADRFFALTLDVIHKPHINVYKIFIALAVNFVADYAGLSFFPTIYAVVIVNIFPLLIDMLVSYFPLKKYFKFNFWDIYVVGYNENILLVKNIYKTLFNKST